MIISVEGLPPTSCPPLDPIDLPLLGLTKGLILLSLLALAGERSDLQGVGSESIMAADSSQARARRRDVEVEELLQKLELSETEREGMVLQKEESAGLPEIKWMAGSGTGRRPEQ